MERDELLKAVARFNSLNNDCLKQTWLKLKEIIPSRYDENFISARRLYMLADALEQLHESAGGRGHYSASVDVSERFADILLTVRVVCERYTNVRHDRTYFGLLEIKPRPDPIDGYIKLYVEAMMCLTD